MPRTPVFYGVSEATVDDLLDRLVDLDGGPRRCLVFGTSMDLLGALCRQWNGQVEITVAWLPVFDADMLEPALTIALREASPQRVRVGLTVRSG